MLAVGAWRALSLGPATIGALPGGMAGSTCFVLSCQYLPHGAAHRERTARRGWRDTRA